MSLESRCLPKPREMRRLCEGGFPLPLKGVTSLGYFFEDWKKGLLPLA